MKEDAKLILIILSISSYGGFSSPYYYDSIMLWKDITLKLLDFKNKDIKDILKNNSYDEGKVKVEYPIDNNTKIKI